MKHKLVGILTIFLMMGALSTITVGASAVKGEWGCHEYPVITGDAKGSITNGYLLTRLTCLNQVAYCFAIVNNGQLIGKITYNGNSYVVTGTYVLQQNGNLFAELSYAGFTGWVAIKIL